MNDFEIDMEDLSIPARMTLKTIEDYLMIMLENNPEMELRKLDLHHVRWDELDKSLTYNSDECYSLATHSYRGVEIVRKEWEE